MRKTRHFRSIRSIRSIVMEHIYITASSLFLDQHLKNCWGQEPHPRRSSANQCHSGCTAEGSIWRNPTGSLRRLWCHGCHGLFGIPQTQTRWIGASHAIAVWVGDMVWKSQNLKVASGSKNNATFMVAGTDNVNPAKLSTDWQEANPNLL